MGRKEDSFKWFKQTFGAEIRQALAGTPFSLDLMTAIAYQETGYIWSAVHDKKPLAEVLALCVGDTIDAPGRSAFPKTKAALLAKPNGPQMFQIARQALVDVGGVVGVYKNIANKNPDKFCHGFGIFQYDIQHFATDPAYFLNRDWLDMTKCVKKCIQELKSALLRAYPGGKPVLTQTEMVYVAIAYNAGHVNVNSSFKQGHFDGTKYYGEYIADYLQLAAHTPEKTTPADVRLIMAYHSPQNALQWMYQAISSAKFETDHFELDRAELESLLAKPLAGPARQAVRPMLTANNVPFIVNTAHMADALDPRVYVFIEA